MLQRDLTACKPKKPGRTTKANKLAPAISFLQVSVCRRHLDRATQACRHELEFRVTKRTHLGQVEALEFTLSADALADQDVDKPVEEVRKRKDDTDHSSAADQLSYQLAQ